MPSSKRKRSNPSTELLKIKKNYYVKKETILEKKTEICGTLFNRVTTNKA
jgi:hypothetical protein